MNIDKVVNDPLHGQLALNQLIWRLIDTPEFQRLRHIKQLPFVSYVYPGAVHTWFEHSIGTAHLANKLVRIIKLNQPKLQINEIDVLCVTIAALFYAIGHGPFSKTFERFANLTLQTESQERFDHDFITMAIIDRLLFNVVKNHPDQMKKLLDDLGEQYHGERLLDIWEGQDDIRTIRLNRNSQDLQFIKDLILPPIDYRNPKVRARKLDDHRYLKKKFLFEIVQNKWSGLDIATLDFIARSSLFTGIRSAINIDRFITTIRIVPQDDIPAGSRNFWCKCPPGSLREPKIDKTCICSLCGGYQRHIVLPEKEDSTVFEIFQTQFSLCKRVFLHKVVVGVELMFLDILMASKDALKINLGIESDITTLDEALEPNIENPISEGTLSAVPARHPTNPTSIISGHEPQVLGAQANSIRSNQDEPVERWIARFQSVSGTSVNEDLTSTDINESVLDEEETSTSINLSLYGIIKELMRTKSTINPIGLDHYLRLTDEIIELIQHLDCPQSERSNLKKAKDLIDRIEKRSQYKFIRDTILNNNYSDEHKSKEAISKIIKSIVDNSRYKDNEFIIERSSFEFGQKGIDPFKRILFFNKTNLNQYFVLSPIRMAAVLPNKVPHLSQVYLRLYYKPSPEEDGGYIGFQTSIRELGTLFELYARPFSTYEERVEANTQTEPE
jgi:HD superfamily phosphohydrolase